MCDALAAAKNVQRKVTNETRVWVSLSLLEDLIACIEQLQAERPLRALAGRLSTSAHKLPDQNTGGTANG